MIDPSERWRRHHGVGEKAAWAGLLTFADVPYTEDQAELAGFDVAESGDVQSAVGTECHCAGTYHISDLYGVAF